MFEVFTKMNSKYYKIYKIELTALSVADKLKYIALQWKNVDMSQSEDLHV